MLFMVSGHVATKVMLQKPSICPHIVHRATKDARGPAATHQAPYVVPMNQVVTQE